MIKQCLTAGAILMLSFSTTSAFAVADASESSRIQWQVEKSWQLPDKPLDIVYSLDGKRVFILTDQQQVLVYTAAGNLLGKIGVKKGVSSIDIAPRGEKLYLLNEKDNSFTDLSVDYIVDINTSGSPFLGKADAPVTIAVFTDFECPHCGKAIDFFKTGGGKKASIDFKVPFLGGIPMDPEIVNTGDSGEPFIIKNAESDTSKAFLDVVENIEKIVNKKR